MGTPFALGSSYARTLQRWDRAFLAASDRVLALGFDETFLRMWHFYLEYSRSGFTSGYLDVHQLTFERAPEQSARLVTKLKMPPLPSESPGYQFWTVEYFTSASSCAKISTTAA